MHNLSDPSPPWSHGSHQIWLTLTELGRRFGMSAVQCGHHLSQAGLRDEEGLPLSKAVDQGYAYKRAEQNANRSVLWNYDRCGGILREHGVRSVEEQRLVEQWANFLEALHVGSSAILVTPQEMADSDMPHHLRPWVNRCLAARGSQLRIARRKNLRTGRDSVMEPVEGDWSGLSLLTTALGSGPVITAIMGTQPVRKGDLHDSEAGLHEEIRASEPTLKRAAPLQRDRGNG